MVRNALSMVWAVIRQRCPECRKGPVFHGLMSMYQECRVCGLRFEREPGYFYGAMYLSYAFAFLSSAYWIILLVMGVNPWIVILLPTIQIILEIPLTFRYSRVAWLAVDHALDPGHDTKWLPESKK
jgi:uncharacterized protein (DUF983 family)